MCLILASLCNGKRLSVARTPATWQRRSYVGLDRADEHPGCVGRKLHITEPAKIPDEVVSMPSLTSDRYSIVSRRTSRLRRRSVRRCKSKRAPSAFCLDGRALLRELTVRLAMPLTWRSTDPTGCDDPARARSGRGAKASVLWAPHRNIWRTNREGTKGICDTSKSSGTGR